MGVNQIVWDPATNTLHMESDALLDQHTRYALIVTRGVRAASGHAIAAARAFQQFEAPVPWHYRLALLHSILAAGKAGIAPQQIAVASVFTTQSVTAVLEKIRYQIKRTRPAPADFLLGHDGSRTVFAMEEVTAASLLQQRATAPLFNPPVNFTLAELRSIPGAVGQIAFGRFVARDYQSHPGDFITPVGTRTGNPVSTGSHAIYFNLVLPSGIQPPDGWPVTIVGHGGGGNEEGFTLGVAEDPRGLACAARDRDYRHQCRGAWPRRARDAHRQPNARAVQWSLPPVAGGSIRTRTASSNRGKEFVRRAPRTIIDDADGFRQTVADLMQLVRQIEIGIDVDGDLTPDLDRSRIYYAAQSLGGVYGTAFVAVEPSVRAAVLNVTGGPRTARTLTTRGDRALVGSYLAARIPSLINAPGVTHIEDVAVPLPPQYHENLPLRDGESHEVRLADGSSQVVQAPLVNTVPEAMAIHEYLDRTEWVMQSASPVAYGPYLRRSPLRGVRPKRVIIQFAKGDQTMPNPATTALLRSGRLGDRATFYRHDLAFAENPALPRDPHGFMPLISVFGTIALSAQEQIAVFFESDGELTIHPEPMRFFEVPIAGPLPEGLNFIR